MGDDEERKSTVVRPQTAPAEMVRKVIERELHDETVRKKERIRLGKCRRQIKLWILARLEASLTM